MTDTNKTVSDDPVMYNLPLSGQKTLLQIKEQYKSVLEQIRNKQNLIAGGSVVWSTSIMGIRVAFRSLRRQEREAFLSPVMTPMDATTDLNKFIKSQTLKLATVITEFNGTQWKLPSLTIDTATKWLEDPAVTQATTYIRSWDETLVELLLTAYAEFDTVRSILLVEDLKNPS